MPTGPLVLELLLLCATGLPALAALLFHAPVLAAAAWAGERIADERNVVPLWRLLVGVPLFLLWASALCVAAWLWLGPWWAAAYVLVSWAGLRCIDRARMLAVACSNALRAPELRARVRALNERLAQEVPR